LHGHTFREILVKGHITCLSAGSGKVFVILGSHSVDCEEYCLLGKEAM